MFITSWCIASKGLVWDTLSFVLLSPRCFGGVQYGNHGLGIDIKSCFDLLLGDVWIQEIVLKKRGIPAQHTCDFCLVDDVESSNHLFF